MPPRPDAPDAERLEALEAALRALDAHKAAWVATPVSARLDLLREVRHAVIAEAEPWVAVALKRKALAADSPLAGEEWSSGPWVVLTTIDLLIESLSHIGDAAFIAGFPRRTTASDQLAVEVFPRTVFDRLLMSGVSAEVWMEPGVVAARLEQTAGPTPADERTDPAGRLALVLGAGNITSIAPLDALHKLFIDDSVVILKLNPVLDTLAPVLQRVLAPLIDAGVLTVVTGGADIGAWLTQHPLVETLHITGSGHSHDAIVFGPGVDGAQRKAEASLYNLRPITSELGGVSPTIVLPGRWSDADLKFQAEHVATQKLHNAGFNCVATQILILPESWDRADAFEQAVRRAIQEAPRRSPYYPDVDRRLEAYAARFPQESAAPNGRLVTTMGADADADDYVCGTEVFGPAMSIIRLPGATPQAFLDAAMTFANTRLHGTLAANIIVDPATERRMGAAFEAAVGRLRYGTVGVNAWSGLGYLLTQTPWGGFPGATPADVQSGIGFVHNAYMFRKAQRSVVRAPFRPFPRTLLHGGFSLLPRPPWFVTNRNAARVARALVDFQARPGWLKLPGIFARALTG